MKRVFWVFGSLFWCVLLVWCVTLRSSHAVVYEENCELIGLFSALPSNFEPSDVVWRSTTQTMLVVSDEGCISELDINGGLKKTMCLGHEEDLEGITLRPQEPDMIYLGIEKPATILQFHEPSQTIKQEWKIQSFMDSVPNEGKKKQSGLESLLYVPQTNQTGFFMVGRQSDGKVFLFDEQLRFLGHFQPPGPEKDLSAMTLWKDKIYFLYDKKKHLSSISAIHPARLLNQQDTLLMESIHSYDFDVRGLEGVAFADTSTGTWVILAIDPPKKRHLPKNLVKIKLRDFEMCFQS